MQFIPYPYQQRGRSTDLHQKQKLWRDRLFGVGHNYALIRSVEDIERLKYILGIMMEEVGK